MSETFKGDYAPELFNEAKKYFLLQAQERQNLTDAELRDLHLISNTQLRRFIQTQLGDYCAIGSGFKIAPNTSDSTNNFKITGGDGTLDHPGTYYLRGYRLILKGDISYKDQTSSTSITSDGYTQTILPALTTPTGSYTSFKDAVFNNSTVIACGLATDSSAVSVTADSGRNWIPKHTATSSETLYALSMGDTSVGFAAGTYGNVVKTTNSGTSWSNIRLNLPPAFWNVHFYGASFVNGSVGWIVGENGSVLKTTNGGSSWIDQTSTLTSTITGISAADANNAWIISSDGTILTTSDGVSWGPPGWPIGIPLSKIQSVDGTYLYSVGESGLILKSTNKGNSWTTLISDVSSNINGLYFSSRTNGWVAGDNGVVSHTTDEGASWSSKIVDASSNFQAITFSGTTGFVFDSSGKIYRTLDGTSWEPYRTDHVYIDFHLAETSADPLMGSEYTDTSLKDATVGLPSANRLRLVSDIKVSEGWPAPTDYTVGSVQHFIAPLASLNRSAGISTIASTNIADARTVVRTISEINTLINTGDFTGGHGGGVTGLQGPTGLQGATGSQGATGAGIQGVTGLPGALGATGIQGATGAGIQGETGLPGAMGATGIQGTTGAGIQGETGLLGPQGTTGPQGETGAGVQGATGLSGPQGAVGATGVQGSTGVQGIQGNTGVQGIDGQTGIQGFTGVPGTTGVQGIQGNTGIQGIQGTTGVQGLQGNTGIQGVDGQTGVQGIQGNTGVQGIQGNTGVQGIQGNTGVQGIQGNTGSQGNTGVQGIQGNTGVQGIDGQTGIQGIQGNTGVQGIQGDTGAGIQGETGVQGDTGPSGATGVGPGAANILPLGWPTDGSYAGIFPWDSSTWTADALDQVNDLLLAISPAPPSALAGSLTGGPTTYSAILPTNLSSAWYQDGQVAGNTVTTYTVTSVYSLASANPSTSFKAGSTFGGDVGRVWHVLDTTNYNFRDMTSGTGSSGTIQISSLATYNTIWRKANAQINYTQTSEGFKRHSMSYVVGATTQQTNDSKFWYDGSNPTPVFALAAAVAQNTVSSSRYLSGVRYYYTGDTFDMTASIQNIANRAIRPTNPVSYSMPGIAAVNLAISGASFTYDGTYNLGLTDAIDTANVSNINATLTVTATKPNGTSASSISTSANRLVNTYSTTYSTNGNIYMVDEGYRWSLTTDMSSIPANYSNPIGDWTSSNALVNGNGQLYDAKWTYPSINYTSGYVPAQSVNYSSFSGDQQILWAVNIGVAHSSMNITFTNIVYTNISAKGSGNLNMEIVLPSVTGWLDCGRAFGDANGCQVGTSSGSSLNLTFGTYSSSGSNGVVFIRVTLRNGSAARASRMVITGT